MKPIKQIVLPFFIILILILSCYSYYLGRRITSDNIDKSSRTENKDNQERYTNNLRVPPAEFIRYKIGAPVETNTKPPEDYNSSSKQNNLNLTSSVSWWEITNTISTIILALTTIALAVFTYRLWLSTQRLSKRAKKTSNRQAKEMRESLDYTKESITLTRDEFFATHRPKIIAHAFEHDVDDQGKISPVITYVNAGSSKATVRMISYVVKETDKLRPGIEMSKKYLDEVVEPGEFKTFTVKSDIHQRSFDVTNMGKGRSQGRNSNIYVCVGEIHYIDTAEKNRVVGFCRMFDHVSGSWNTNKDSSYEYNY